MIMKTKQYLPNNTDDFWLEVMVNITVGPSAPPIIPMLEVTARLYKT